MCSCFRERELFLYVNNVIITAVCWQAFLSPVAHRFPYRMHKTHYPPTSFYFSPHSSVTCSTCVKDLKENTLQLGFLYTQKKCRAYKVSMPTLLTLSSVAYSTLFKCVSFMFQILRQTFSVTSLWMCCAALDFTLFNECNVSFYIQSCFTSVYLFKVSTSFS